MKNKEALMEELKKQKIKLLLVDDQVIFTESLATCISNYAEDIEITGMAQNGQEAVDEAIRTVPDVIVMDVRMPVMDGLTAARLIRSSKHEDSARIPIIAMTANAFSEDIKQTQESGMNAHLSKPIDVDVLYTTISCLIAGTC